MSISTFFKKKTLIILVTSAYNCAVCNPYTKFSLHYVVYSGSFRVEHLNARKISTNWGI